MIRKKTLAALEKVIEATRNLVEIGMDRGQGRDKKAAKSKR